MDEKIVEEALSGMELMFRKMLEADSGFLSLGAQVLKRTYDELIAAGFTEEQAILIVAGKGISANVNR